MPEKEDLNNMPELKKEEIITPSEPEKKYPALRIISGIYETLAWILGFGVALSGLIVAGTQKKVYGGGITSSGIIIAVVSIIVGALLLIGLLAVAEIIKLFIDVEENTRSTKEILETKISV